jgi:hypothetical protein
MTCNQQEELRVFMQNLGYGEEEIDGPPNILSLRVGRLACLAIIVQSITNTFLCPPFRVTYGS